MKFTIDGREVEDYNLSNGDIVYLINSENTSADDKEFLTKKMKQRFTAICCPRNGEDDSDVFARQFSDFVNNYGSNLKKAASAMGRDHRYLQSEMFKLCIEYIKVLAEHYNNGCYDPRNEWACSTAYSIIDEFNTL